MGSGICAHPLFQKGIQVEVEKFLAFRIIKAEEIFRFIAGKPAAVCINNGSILVVALP